MNSIKGRLLVWPDPARPNVFSPVIPHVAQEFDFSNTFANFHIITSQPLRIPTENNRHFRPNKSKLLLSTYSGPDTMGNIHLKFLISSYSSVRSLAFHETLLSFSAKEKSS